ncbi:putative thioesterase [Balneicella halophila]|uniref:Putative thioesterase n=1 Tax=Balneicella halophila TaxID=1537566 RepID=A0A7L4US28_BALHA|nr:thioesterase family protein [Balneicella halophila]PVX51754.1 putative thioesterase [Balneicella halophila]
MEVKIKEGITLQQKRTVALDDTAIKYGSGLAEVYATPAMISFMENTAYRSIESFLPEGYSTVGISINVQHTKATLPGKKVDCQSIVTKVDGKKVFFKIEASDEEGKIGTADHVRYIVNSEEFVARLKK